MALEKPQGLTRTATGQIAPRRKDRASTCEKGFVRRKFREMEHGENHDDDMSTAQVKRPLRGNKERRTLGLIPISGFSSLNLGDCGSESSKSAHPTENV